MGGWVSGWVGGWIYRDAFGQGEKLLPVHLLDCLGKVRHEGKSSCTNNPMGPIHEILADICGGWVGGWVVGGGLGRGGDGGQERF